MWVESFPDGRVVGLDLGVRGRRRRGHPDPPRDTQLRTANWHTSSLSSGGSTCVQVAFLDHGLVALRDSKNPGKAPHLFTDAEWDAFVGGIMNGELRRPAVQGHGNPLSQ